MWVAVSGGRVCCLADFVCLLCGLVGWVVLYVYLVGLCGCCGVILYVKRYCIGVVCCWL